MSNISKNKSFQSAGWLVLFAIVLLDSLMTYFGRNFFGILFPINALLPVWLLVMLFRHGVKAVLPSLAVNVWVSIAVLGYFLGIIMIHENSWRVLFEVGTALTAFYIGFATGRWNNKEEHFIKLFLIVGGVYIFVCIGALIKLAPAILPIVNDVGNYQGATIIRPSITVDQNFQVFYVFMPSLVLALRFRLFYSSIAILLTVGALFILGKLQTRSGVIIMAVIILLSLIAPLIYPKLGRKKVIVLPLIAIIVITLSINTIMDSSHEITNRFSGNRLETLYGRLFSAMYMFENLFDLSFWLPQGESKFVKATGNIPHFTPTACYLQGGILALTAWCALFIIPLVRMTKLFFYRKLDDVSIMIFFGTTATMIAQLTLNAPFFEQTWLWAGASIGVLQRLKAQKKELIQKRSNYDKPNERAAV